MGSVALEGFGGSGGNILNFKVVGGTTAPENPKENTIWVNMSTELTSYVFSATEPENPENGMVWIRIGTGSPVEFNALKKNAIQVYPISAQRYNNGWAEKGAKSYQGGEWVEWIDWTTYFFYMGMTTVSGEWSIGNFNNPGYSSYDSATVTIADGCIVLTGHNNNAWPENTCDLTDVSSIVVNMKNTESTEIGVVKTKASGFKKAAYVTVPVSSSFTEVSLDVSSLSGEYYIVLFVFGSNTITVESIKRI